MKVVSHLEWHCKGFEGRGETAPLIAYFLRVERILGSHH